MTTRLRSADASKGIPVNYCSGFRSLSMKSAFEVDGFNFKPFVCSHLLISNIKMKINLNEIIMLQEYHVTVLT